MTDNGVQSESGSTSGSLLQRARARDAAAWEKLTKVYGPLVYRWCRRAGLQASDAADVVQEVFRSVADAIGRFRKGRPSDSFRGWLWTIARNKIRDHFRRRAAEPQAIGGSTAQLETQQLAEVAPDETDDGSRERLKSSLARRAVMLMQEDFEERTWQAFWRTAVDERDPAEVAQQLGMSRASVYMARSRVLRRLRQELDGLELVE